MVKHEIIVILFNRVLGKYKYHVWPIGWITIFFHKYGVEFPWRGDWVIWTWPWNNRNERSVRGKFISVGFSGTGEFGDARFKSLESIDDAWDGCLGAIREKLTKDESNGTP